jgi:hypothetical protein
VATSSDNRDDRRDNPAVAPSDAWKAFAATLFDAGRAMIAAAQDLPYDVRLDCPDKDSLRYTEASVKNGFRDGGGTSVEPSLRIAIARPRECMIASKEGLPALDSLGRATARQGSLRISPSDRDCSTRRQFSEFT